MDEATKTYTLLTNQEQSFLCGKGIDIGCGPDPINPEAFPFDTHCGDANRILDFLPAGEQYDFVFSSHCLEHMFDPQKTLLDWWSLVKPGGVMILTVPDEDLYEQGYWPSIFNYDHKHTFTIGKQKSWSPVSVNLLALIQSLPNKDWFTIELMDAGYDHNKKSFGTLSNKWAQRLMDHKARIAKYSKFVGKVLENFFILFRLPIDQTLDDGLAQIKVVVKKVESRG